MTPSDSMRGRASALLAGVFTVGVAGFGGGSALIPIFEQEMVAKRGLLRPGQFLRHTVVANLTPGALPVKLAAAAGVTVGGWQLSLVAALLVALPGALGTVALLALADALGPDAVRLISYASVGITAFIVVLLIGYITNVHAKAGPRLGAYVVITMVSALTVGGHEIVALVARLTGVDLQWPLPRLNALQLILVSLALIVAWSLWSGRKGVRSHSGPLGGSEPEQPPAAPAASGSAGSHGTGFGRAVARATAAWIVVALVGVGLFVALHPQGAQLGGLLAASSVSSFGGGEAYVGVADGFFVQAGLSDRTLFYTQLVPIANTLPGPILVKVAAGIGYLAGLPAGPTVAWVLAAAASLATIGACSAVALPVLGTYERMKNHPIVVNIGHYILPVICGLLISVCATMFHVSADVGETAGVPALPLLGSMLAAIVLMTWLHLRTRVPDLLILIAAGAFSLTMLLAA